ncbi:hypothetical protein L9F63_016481 [Diploptera punctata]|uniref:Uncharacterized protein n=1 Tax=Diploptera punctata TaxID=6984 RepID=A0AAD8A302_DIPPU|nr:hypothetical protein L9F63_016481 [Diploptera punctata]
MCSIVHLASVKCQCDLGEAVKYDPEMVEGNSYVGYSAPSLFDNLKRVSMEFKLVGETYESVITLTFKNETKPKKYDSTWKITKNGDRDVKVPELPDLDAVYRIVAAKENKYIIFRGCPEISQGKPLMFIETREKCPDETALKKAVDDLNLDYKFENFTRDKTVNC